MSRAHHQQHKRASNQRSPRSLLRRSRSRQLDCRPVRSGQIAITLCECYFLGTNRFDDVGLLSTRTRAPVEHKQRTERTRALNTFRFAHVCAHILRKLRLLVRWSCC